MPNYASLLGNAGGANAPILGLNKKKPQNRYSIGPIGGMGPGPAQIGEGGPRTIPGGPDLGGRSPIGGQDRGFLPEGHPRNFTPVSPVQMGGPDESTPSGPRGEGGYLTPPPAASDPGGGYSMNNPYMNPYGGGAGMGMGMGYGGFNPYSMFRMNPMGGMRISPWASMLGGGGYGFGGYGGMNPFMGMQMPYYY